MIKLCELFNSDDNIIVDREMIRKIGMREAVTLQTIKDMMNDDKFITYEALRNELTFFGEKALRTLLNHLVNSSYITMSKLGPSEKLEMLKLKDLKGKGIGNSVCPCCNCRTLTLHNHHYPIPRHLNGTETIPLCPSCHYEYHYLGAVDIIKLRQEI